MAEYRGLTIRIGADVGDFKQSMKSTQTSIAATQKSLNELKKAMVLDPGNNNVGALYIKEIQANAVAASAKVGVLAQQIAQITSAASKSKDTTIGELAKETDDAVLSAKRATEHYNEMTAALKQVNDQLNKTQAVQTMLKAYENSRGQFGLKGELKSPNTSLEVYQKIYDLRVASGEITREQANEELALIQRLKSGWQDANDSRADADMVMQLHNAQVEAANLEAKVKAAINEMANSAQSNLGRELKEDAEVTERLSTGVRQASESLSNVDRALSFDTTSMDSVADKSLALTNMQGALRVELESVQQALGKINAAGIEDLTGDTGALATKTEEARRAYMEAADEVRRLRTEYDAVTAAAAHLEATDKKDTDEYRSKVEQAEQLEAKLTEANATLLQTETEYTRLKDANSFVDLTNQAGDLENRMRDVSAEAERLGEVIRKAASDKVDSFNGSKLFRGWEEASVTVDKLSNGIQETSTYVSNLDAALRFDPSNMEVIVQKAMALTDGMVMADDKVESLTQTMEGFKTAGIDRFSAGIADANAYLETAKERAVDAHEAVMTLLVERSTAGSGTSRTIKEITEDLKEARKEAKNADNALAKAQEVVAYRKVRDDLISATNEAENFRNALREIAEAHVSAAKGSELSEEVDKASQSIRTLETDTQRFSNEFRTLDSLFKLDTDDTDVASRRMQALQNAITLTKEKASELRDILARYESAGIDKIAEGSTRTAEDVERARQAFVDADQAVVLASQHYEEMRRTASQMAQDGDAHGKNWIEQARAIKEAKDSLDQAREAADEAHQAFNEARDVAGYQEVAHQFDEATLAGKQYEQQLKEIEQAAEEAAVKSVEAFRTTVSTDSGWTQAQADIKAISDDAAMAKSRFEALDKALELNPGNIDLIRSRQQALSEATELTQKKAKELQTVLDKYKADGIDKVAAKYKSVTKALEEAKKRAEEAEKEVARLTATMQKADKGDDSYNDLANSLNKAEEAAKEARVELEQLQKAADFKSAQSQADGLAADLEGIDKAASESADKMSTAFFQALQQVSQYSRQAIQEIASASYDLEDAFTNMMKTVDGSDEQYKHLKDAAVEASLTNPVSADQILNVEALGGQLGFTIDELEEFQRVANGLDISTNMSWEEASTNMAQFANIMKMDHDDIGRYGAAIVDLGNNFATTEADISDMAMRIAGAGATLGLSEADVLGLSAALTSMGLTAEAGGSSISQIMLKIDKAVANGTAGVQEYADKAGMSVGQFLDHVKSLDNDALTDFAKGLGTTAKDLQSSTVEASEQLKTWAETAGYDSAEKFAQAWNESPIKALQAVFSGMDAAAEDGTNIALLLDDLNIKTIRQGDVARRLASNSGLLTEAVNASNNAWRENIALDTEVERRNSSLSGRMDVLSNAFTAVKTELGEGLTPWVEAGIEALTGFVKALDSMSDGTKSAIIGILGITTALAGGGSIWAAASEHIDKMFSIMAKSGGSIISSIPVLFGNIGSAVGAATAAVKAFVMAHATLLSIVGPLALIVGGLVIKWKQEQDAINSFNGEIGHLSDTADRLKGSLGSGAQAVEDFGIYVSNVTMSSLTEELKDFNKALDDIVTPVEESNALLGQYQTVIDNFAGKGAASAGEMAQLEWALDGINQQLGTNFTAQDVLTNKYKDEETEINNLMGHIDSLIAKRQQQAKVEAAQQVYTETLKEQIKLENDKKKAVQSYESYRDDLIARYNRGRAEQGLELFTEERMLDPNDTMYNAGLAQMKQNVEAADAAVKEMNEDVKISEQVLEDAVKATGDDAVAISRAIASHEAWTNALQDQGLNMDYVATRMSEAGISTKDLGRIYDDTSVAFADMVASSGGDIDELIAQVEAYNRQTVNASESTKKMAEAIKSHETWGDALTQQNVDLNSLVLSLNEAGISAEDLGRIYDDTSVSFADMVAQSGGSIEKLIEIIKAYNDTDPETKEVNQEGAEETKAAVEETTAAVEEADGKSATYEIGEMGSEEVKAAAEDTAEAVEAAGGTAESEFTQSGGEEVVEQANEIKAAKEEAAGSDNQVDMSITATNEVTPVIEEIRGEIASLSEASAVIPITATNEASPVIEEIRGQLMSLAEAFTPPPISINPEEYDAQLETAQKTLDAIRQKNIPQLHANNAPLISAVQNAQSAINGLRGRTVYVYVDVNTSEIAAAESRIASLSNKAATVGKNAAGGIRYHAEGFIADRPTWISNRDIVGEAGAEAIIPLTNKKYVDPFAGAVANQMLHKMNGVDGGNTITVNLNYKAGDDANQMARDLARALGRIQRTGR